MEVLHDADDGHLFEEIHRFPEPVALEPQALDGGGSDEYGLFCVGREVA